MSPFLVGPVLKDPIKVLADEILAARHEFLLVIRKKPKHRAVTKHHLKQIISVRVILTVPNFRQVD